jgi:hypothetical protein
MTARMVARRSIPEQRRCRSFPRRTIMAVTGIVLSLHPCVLSQPAKAERPDPRALFEIAKPPYLLVYDCTRGSNCRQLGPKHSVAIVDGFMFFSLLSKGVDPDVPHKVTLKIAGTEVPGALSAILARGPDVQRLNFIVDTQKHKWVRTITPLNIQVWVDGISIVVPPER